MDMIGNSRAMADLKHGLEKAARCDKTVLILGETGAGKDLAARRIHEMSARSTSPFLALNCSALPETLFESELFGHARGAFTGAVSEKEGLIEAAGRGTLFMDEIGELPPVLQAKLLRLLDKKEARRVGGTVLRAVEARFIFATNRNLALDVRCGKFRKDLYYRINVVCLHVPALRDRKDDIPELAFHFLDRENRRNNCRKRLSKRVLERLYVHDFPGNVRELENIIERAFVSADSDTIGIDDIRFDPGDVRAKPGPAQIKEALDRCRWRKTAAARDLGISRRQLYRLLEKSGLED
jgi:Transcriptional regulator containing PAS, AAA-type ATPase, and DNA-binding domains